VCYKVSSSKNFQQHSCSAINYLSNGINIFAGDDPVPVKFGPKGTDPQQEKCAFHVLHTERWLKNVMLYHYIGLRGEVVQKTILRYIICGRPLYE